MRYFPTQNTEEVGSAIAAHVALWSPDGVQQKLGCIKSRLSIDRNNKLEKPMSFMAPVQIFKKGVVVRTPA